MLKIEPIGFSDPDAVERHLQKLLGGESFYDQVVFIKQTRMSFLLKDPPSVSKPHLRISASQESMFESGDAIVLCNLLEPEYDLEVVMTISIPKDVSDQSDLFFIPP